MMPWVVQEDRVDPSTGSAPGRPPGGESGPVGERRPAPGCVQMARDEFILQRAVRDGQPCMRLYAWDRLTLSIGRTQQAERQVDLNACRRLGIPVVRRMTGGRAVLHGTDLTYAVAAPLGGKRGPFAAAASQGISGLYRELSRAFLRFFAELGFSPRAQAYTSRQRAELASPVCFATPAAYEILLDGKKLVGSAQRLLPGGFLQHGSIPLAPQGDVLAQVFRDGSGEAMAEVMTDLTTTGVLPRLTLDEVRERLLASFAAEFGVAWMPMPWSEEDDAAVAALARGYEDLAAEPRAAEAVPAMTYTT